MNARRPLLSFATASLVLLASVAALAEQGTVTLKSGEVLTGDIRRVVQGDYVLIKLANGELKAVTWSDIGAIQSPSVTFKAPSPSQPPTQPPAPAPAPPPAPEPSSAPVPAPAPAPAPAVAPAPAPAPEPEPASEFRPVDLTVPPPPPARPKRVTNWVLGGRIGTMDTSDIDGTGWLVMADLGLHFSPSWTLFTSFEHGELPKNANTNALGFGFKTDTNPKGAVGFYWEIGLSYRWFTHDGSTYDYTTQTSRPTRQTDSGFQLFRTGIGLSIKPVEKLRLDLLAYLEAGSYSDSTACSTCGHGSYAFTGLATGMRWDL